MGGYHTRITDFRCPRSFVSDIFGWEHKKLAKLLKTYGPVGHKLTEFTIVTKIVPPNTSNFIYG